jgi:hypothetical protein
MEVFAGRKLAARLALDGLASRVLRGVTISRRNVMATGAGVGIGSGGPPCEASACHVTIPGGVISASGELGAEIALEKIRLFLAL